MPEKKKVLTEDWLNNADNFIIPFVTEKEETQYQVFSVYKIEKEDYYIDYIAKYINCSNNLEEETPCNVCRLIDKDNNPVDYYTEAGTYTIKITGAGNYAGNLTATYSLKNPKEAVLMSSAAIKGLTKTIPYTGSAITLDMLKQKPALLPAWDPMFLGEE